MCVLLLARILLSFVAVFVFFVFVFCFVFVIGFSCVFSDFDLGVRINIYTRCQYAVSVFFCVFVIAREQPNTLAGKRHGITSVEKQRVARKTLSPHLTFARQFCFHSTTSQ